MLAGDSHTSDSTCEVEFLSSCSCHSLVEETVSRLARHPELEEWVEVEVTGGSERLDPPGSLAPPQSVAPPDQGTTPPSLQPDLLAFP